MNKELKFIDKLEVLINEHMESANVLEMAEDLLAACTWVIMKNRIHSKEYALNFVDKLIFDARTVDQLIEADESRE